MKTQLWPYSLVVAALSAATGAFADVSLNAVGDDGKISLSWTTTDNLRSIQVYRDTDADPQGRQRIAILSGNTRSYTDNTAVNGTQYWYWIKYTDANGGVGNSNAGSAMPAAGGNSSNENDNASGNRVCTGNGTLPTGDSRRSVSVGGKERSYFLHVPQGYTGKTAVPLIIDYHGYGGDGAGEKGWSGFANQSEVSGFIVAYPDGVGGTWNYRADPAGEDDVGFSKAIISDLADEACIDKSRVYAAGFSMGGGMSYTVACHAADVFAAVVSSSFDLYTGQECNPSRPISVLSFRGLADGLAIYDGSPGFNGAPFIGAKATLKQWAAINHCSGVPQTDASGCEMYTNCDAGTQVGLCSVQGGGHLSGGAQESWDFLKQFTLSANGGSTNDSNSGSGASAAPQSGHVYKLQNANSGKVLGILGMSASDGAKALQWGDNGTRDHEWRIDLLSDGYYKLTNLNSGKVLAVLGMSTNDGGEVIQWSDNGTPDHEWKLVGSTGGSYKLVNRNSGKALGILGMSKDDGATALQWGDNGTSDHDWKLVDLGTDGGDTGNSNGDTGGGGAATFTLSVGVSGNGSTSLSAASHSYQSGTAVTITATPDSGYDFSGWSGAFAGNTNPLTITVDGNKMLTAIFTAKSNGGGSSDSASSGGSGGGESNSSNNAGATTTQCDVPALWDTASLAHSEVGTGSPASCTYSELAAAVAKGGYITFNCGGSATTIAVSSRIPVSSGKTTIIDGGGTVTLDGGGTSRIFELGSWNSLSVRKLTLKNGYSVTPGVGDLPDSYSGGAIVGGYQSKLEIVDSTLQNNRSSSGGAIYIGSDAALTIVRSTFAGNASWYGGAIMSMLSGLTVVDSTFTGNSAAQTPSNGYGLGGAITTDGARLKSLVQGGTGSGGTLSVCGTAFKNNSGVGGGGGVWLWAYAPDNIIVKNSTFEGNTTQGLGGAGRISVGPTDYSHQGGIMTTPGTINIVGSSFLTNAAQGNGGALYVDCYGDCNIANSTFYGNDAKGVGGAIQHVGWGTDVGSQATTVNFNNVTFADNSNGHSVLFGSKFALNNTVMVSHSAQAMCSDPASNSGHNVLQYSSLGSTTGCIGSGSILTSDPLLSAPADNGGPTHTMLPSSNSPLLGAGTNCLPIDQRGKPRNTSMCDIGSVELP